MVGEIGLRVFEVLRVSKWWKRCSVNRGKHTCMYCHSAVAFSQLEDQ